MLFECVCQFNHFLIKEAENPLKKMIRLSNQTNQIKSHFAYNAFLISYISKMQHLCPKTNVFNAFHTKKKVFILLTVVQRPVVPVGSISVKTLNLTLVFRYQ